MERKWIYNPYIHGNEDDWRNDIELYFKVTNFIVEISSPK